MDWLSLGCLTPRGLAGTRQGCGWSGELYLRKPYRHPYKSPRNSVVSSKVLFLRVSFFPSFSHQIDRSEYSRYHLWGDFCDDHSNIHQLDSFPRGVWEASIWRYMICEISPFEMRRQKILQAALLLSAIRYWGAGQLWVCAFQVVFGFINVTLRKILHNFKGWCIFFGKVAQSFQMVINHLRALVGLKGNIC